MTRRWMSCAQDTDWHTARHRHLVTISAEPFDKGWVDTLCGATGTPGAFRRNHSKPPCPACCAVAGIAVPSSGQTERGSVMPTTTKKRGRPARSSMPMLTPEQVKESARAYADRAHRAKKEGMTVRPWVVLYIQRWRYLSGLKAQSVPGPKPVNVPAQAPKR